MDGVINNKRDETPDERGWLANVGYLLVWLAATILIVVDIALARAAILHTIAWWSERMVEGYAAQIDFSFRSSFIYMAAFVAVAIAGFAGIVVVEHHFRRLSEEQQMLRQGWKPFAILLGIALFTVLVRVVL